MNTTLRYFTSGAIGLVAALPLTCQEPADLAPAFGQGGVSPVEFRDGALRGIGPSYRAAFGAHGLEFTPALGVDAPRTMPWRFEVERISRGSETLWEAGAWLPAEPLVADAGDVRLAHGAHVVETFELRDEGVKQSFVFDRWGAEGDLVVRGRVHSELGALQQGELQEVSYDFGALGGVHLGKVLGIDGDGSTGQGFYRVDGDVLEMVLPEAFVAGAAAPLVLDPLVSSRRSGPNSSRPDRDPRISYEGRSGVYLAVWERAFSINDVAVVGAFRGTDARGLPLGAFTIANGGVNRKPDVNRMASGSGFVVAYEHSSGFLATRSIEARLVRTDASGVFITPPTTVSASGDCVDPTVAGSSDRAVPVAAVAWHERNGGIKIRQIFVSASSLTLAAARTLTSSRLAGRPVFSRSTTTRHAIAYENRISSQDRTEFIVGRLNADLSSAGSSHRSSEAGFDHVDAAIDGDGDRFRLVYVRRALGSADSQIREEQIDWPSPTGGVPASSSNAMVAETANPEVAPSVCLMGPLYLVAWAKNTNTNNGEVHVMTRGLTTCGPCGREYVVGTARGSDATPCVIGRFSGDPTQSDAVVAWSSFDSTFPFNSQVYFQLFEAFGGSSLTTARSGCGISATLRSRGTFAIGSPDFALEVTNRFTPLQSILLISLDGSVTPDCGRCAMLTTPIAFPVTVDRSGVGTVGIPIPCDPGLDGGSLWFQVANINSQTGECPLVPELSLTSVLTGTLRD